MNTELHRRTFLKRGILLGSGFLLLGPKGQESVLVAGEPEPSTGPASLRDVMPKEPEIKYGSNPAAGQYVDVNGVKLYFEVYGQGQPLLLLHGGLGSIGGFSGIIPELARHFRVYACDRRGHGRSSDNGEPFSYLDMAEETVGFMDAIHIRQAAMLGFSDGGTLAYHIAIRHPDRIAKLIAVGANARLDGLAIRPEKYRTMLNPAEPAAWVRAMEPEYARLSPRPDYKLYLQRTRDLWTGDSYPTRESFNAISLPVLLVAGDRDAVRIEHIVDLYRSLKQAQLCVLPNCDHFIPEKRASWLNAIVVEYLGKRSDRRSG
jgi:pimeloyl-ACP methyl ester carboxylesterase